MRKTQLFSPVYVIIFSIVILSVLTFFKSVVFDWEEHAILEGEVYKFNTILFLTNDFDSYSYTYNTVKLLNLSISKDFVNFSSKKNNIKTNNYFNLPDSELVNVDEVSIVKSSGEWVIT